MATFQKHDYFSRSVWLEQLIKPCRKENIGRNKEKVQIKCLILWIVTMWWNSYLTVQGRLFKWQDMKLLDQPWKCRQPQTKPKPDVLDTSETFFLWGRCISVCAPCLSWFLTGKSELFSGGTGLWYFFFLLKVSYNVLSIKLKSCGEAADGYNLESSGLVISGSKTRGKLGGAVWLWWMLMSIFSAHVKLSQLG